MTFNPVGNSSKKNLTTFLHTNVYIHTAILHHHHISRACDTYTITEAQSYIKMAAFWSTEYITVCQYSVPRAWLCLLPSAVDLFRLKFLCVVHSRMRFLWNRTNWTIGKDERSKNWSNLHGIRRKFRRSHYCGPTSPSIELTLLDSTFPRAFNKLHLQNLLLIIARVIRWRVFCDCR